MNERIGRPIRVLTVDHHPIVREGIAALLAGQPDMMLIGEAGRGREAIAFYREHRPDVTLMDLRMPDMSGLQAIATIRAEFADARVIVLTACTGDIQAATALRAGARGYLLKSLARSQLLETIRAVHAGDRRVSIEVATEIAEHVSDDPLTGREIEILKRAASGCSNKGITVQLRISEDKVKAHLKSILGKLGARNRTHAVTIALKRGVFDL